MADADAMEGVRCAFADADMMEEGRQAFNAAMEKLYSTREETPKVFNTAKLEEHGAGLPTTVGASRRDWDLSLMTQQQLLRKC